VTRSMNKYIATILFALIIFPLFLNSNTNNGLPKIEVGSKPIDTAINLMTSYIMGIRDDYIRGMVAIVVVIFGLFIVTGLVIWRKLKKVPQMIDFKELSGFKNIIDSNFNKIDIYITDIKVKMEGFRDQYKSMDDTIKELNTRLIKLDDLPSDMKEQIKTYTEINSSSSNIAIEVRNITTNQGMLKNSLVEIEGAVKRMVGTMRAILKTYDDE